MKTILFDVDGTLYPFKDGYLNSRLASEVNERAFSFVKKFLDCSYEEAKKIMLDISVIEGENISIALKNRYGISKETYFNNVWDIDPVRVIDNKVDLTSIFKYLSLKYQLIAVSDAPYVWVTKALSYLGIKDLFFAIETGENDQSKKSKTLFSSVIEKYGLDPTLTISIGDQEETDIIPAKELGMKTVCIGESNFADVSVNSISNICDGISQLQNRQIQIGVMGSAADLNYGKEVEQKAKEMGTFIAQNNALLVFGAEQDSDSLSTVAARAARLFGGTTLGVTYNTSKDIFDPTSASILIACGLARGGGREFVLIGSCDVIIAIGGGSGTLTEIAQAYQLNIPVVVLANTGGWSEKLANTYLDARERFKIISANSPEQAVQLAIELARANFNKQRNIQGDQQ